MAAKQRSHHVCSEVFFKFQIDLFLDALILYTVGPLIIESLWAKKRVSTGALGALDDSLVVQTKI